MMTATLKATLFEYTGLALIIIVPCLVLSI